MQKIREDWKVFLPIFQNILRDLSQADSEAKRVEIFRKAFYYLLRTRDKDSKELKNETLYKIEGLGEEFMTLYEEIVLEGEIRGEKKGEKRGKLEGKLETAEKMLGEKIDLSIILRVTGLTETDLKNRGLI